VALLEGVLNQEALLAFHRLYCRQKYQSEPNSCYSWRHLQLFPWLF